MKRLKMKKQIKRKDCFSISLRLYECIHACTQDDKNARVSEFACLSGGRSASVCASAWVGK